MKTFALYANGHVLDTETGDSVEEAILKFKMSWPYYEDYVITGFEIYIP